MERKNVKKEEFRKFVDGLENKWAEIAGGYLVADDFIWNLDSVEQLNIYDEESTILTLIDNRGRWDIDVDCKEVLFNSNIMDGWNKFKKSKADLFSDDIEPFDFLKNYCEQFELEELKEEKIINIDVIFKKYKNIYEDDIYEEDIRKEAKRMMDKLEEYLFCDLFYLAMYNKNTKNISFVICDERFNFVNFF